MLTFIDDFSRKVWLFFLKEKCHVFAIFKQWKILIENQTDKKIKGLRIDNGLEFYNEDFNKFCKNEGIVRHKIVIGALEQNSVAERMNKILLEKARFILSHAG
jgi:transposase InsO family protein